MPQARFKLACVRAPELTTKPRLQRVFVLLFSSLTHTCETQEVDTHTEKYVRWNFNAAPAASRHCGLNCKHTPAASHGNLAAPSFLAIPQHPSINSLSLPSVTRGIKHPSLLTTHTVKTKLCVDLLKHFRGVVSLNDADVKREKESLSPVQMVTGMVLCPKRSGGSFQEFLLGV